VTPTLAAHISPDAHSRVSSGVVPGALGGCYLWFLSILGGRCAPPGIRGSAPDSEIFPHIALLNILSTPPLPFCISWLFFGTTLCIVLKLWRLRGASYQIFRPRRGLHAGHPPAPRQCICVLLFTTRHLSPRTQYCQQDGITTDHLQERRKFGFAPPRRPESPPARRVLVP